MAQVGQLLRAGPASQPLYIFAMIFYYVVMYEKQSNQSQDATAELELVDFFGADGKLEVTAVATERPGVYDLHGSVLTNRFVKLSEAFPDMPTPPIDWC